MYWLSRPGHSEHKILAVRLKRSAHRQPPDRIHSDHASAWVEALSSHDKETEIDKLSFRLYVQGLEIAYLSENCV